MLEFNKAMKKNIDLLLDQKKRSKRLRECFPYCIAVLSLCILKT